MHVYNSTLIKYIGEHLGVQGVGCSVNLDDCVVLLDIAMSHGVQLVGFGSQYRVQVGMEGSQDSNCSCTCGYIGIE